MTFQEGKPQQLRGARKHSAGRWRAKTPIGKSYARGDRRSAISMLDSPQVSTVSMSWQPPVNPADRRHGARSLAMGLAPDASPKAIKKSGHARKAGLSVVEHVREARSSRLQQYYLDRQDIYSPETKLAPSELVAFAEGCSQGNADRVPSSGSDEVSWLPKGGLDSPTVLSPPFNPTQMAKLPSPQSCPASPQPHQLVLADSCPPQELEPAPELRRMGSKPDRERATMPVATATAHFSPTTQPRAAANNRAGPPARSHSTPPVRSTPPQGSSSAWVLLPERQVLLPPGNNTRRAPSFQLHQPPSPSQSVQWMQGRLRAERNGQAFL